MKHKMGKEEFKEAMMAAQEVYSEAPAEENPASVRKDRRTAAQGNDSICETAKELTDKAETLIMESQELIYKAEKLIEVAETLEELVEGGIA